MRKIVLAVAACVVLFASCKEVGPTIEQGSKEDSTYTAAVETPQQRNVMIEEFTGVSCPYCPQGHQLIEGFEASYPDRVMEVRVYPFNVGQAEPVPGLTQQDFRTQKGTDLGTVFYGGVSFLPCAAVDRIPVSGKLLLDRGVWSAQVNARMITTPPVNLNITSNYNSASNTVDIAVKTAFTQTVNKKMNLTVAIVQDSIVDAQEYPSYKDTFYVHNNVLRDFITPYAGSEILSDASIQKVPGRVYIRKFSYQLNTTWNPAHCKIVAWLSNNEANDFEVAQAAMVKVK